MRAIYGRGERWRAVPERPAAPWSACAGRDHGPGQPPTYLRNLLVGETCRRIPVRPMGVAQGGIGRGWRSPVGGRLWRCWFGRAYPASALSSGEPGMRSNVAAATARAGEDRPCLAIALAAPKASPMSGRPRHAPLGCCPPGEPCCLSAGGSLLARSQEVYGLGQTGLGLIAVLRAAR